MHIPSLALALIKKYEGFSNKVYICPAGYKTIGYGHLIKSKDKVGDYLSRAEAEELLQNDIIFYAMAVMQLIKVPLTEMQFAALISFTFNLGSAALERSTLRQKINRFEYNWAAEEFLKWVFAGGVRLSGLVKRREEERAVFLACGLQINH